MQRLGNLVVPSALAPQLSQAPSVTSLALPPPGSTVPANVSSSTSNDPWGALHVHVLPLFNGEPLRIPMWVFNYFYQTFEANNARMKRGFEYPSQTAHPICCILLPI